MNKQKVSFRAVTPQLLQNIQWLYQNGEIGTETKNELVKMTKNGLTGSVKELQQYFMSVKESVTFMTNVVDDCIMLIQQTKG